MNLKKRLHKIKVNHTLINIILLIVLALLLIKYLTTINSSDQLKQNFQDQVYSDFKHINDLITSNIASSTELANPTSTTITKNGVKIVTKNKLYVKIKDSCDIHFGGACVRARACPALNCPTIASLRNEMVLETNGEIIDADGISWYHIIFSEWVRYPERTAKDWYIASDYLEPIKSYTSKISSSNAKKITTDKKIIVNLTEQKMYAYEGENLFMETFISSGLEDLPTPRGTFRIFEKTPSRYMQGPLPGISDQYYDLPGVPWTMYFNDYGAAIHGAYWHDSFGNQWSHGCVNLEPEEAEKMYVWADIGTVVIVKD